MNERLIAAREETGYSQQQVAELTGLSQAAISLMEHGHRDPRRKTMEKLANLYGKSIAQLFF